MAADVAQKDKSGDDQPKGGRAIVSIGGSKGLTAANKVNSNHTLEPSIASSNIDEPIDSMFTKLKDRFDDYNTYSA
jgi:hypothetical protein|tara:strand:+ start:13785 stop:14012 length:228 start_codon:yes stop_codon:yes gene_type:complete